MPAVFDLLRVVKYPINRRLNTVYNFTAPPALLRVFGVEGLAALAA